jgi:hypothetical protein
MGRACITHEVEEECMKDIYGKARRLRCRWEDNIKMDLKKDRIG